MFEHAAALELARSRGERLAARDLDLTRRALDRERRVEPARDAAGRDATEQQPAPASDEQRQQARCRFTRRLGSSVLQQRARDLAGRGVAPHAERSRPPGARR